MLTSEFKLFRFTLMGLSIALSAAISSPAKAFDINAGVTKESGPFDLFKFGFKAYKSGQKEEAIEAYKYAAEKGHTGSRWALANMYADGDGVAQDDFEAFKIYSEIAQQGVEPGSEDTGFFINALLSLANYYKHGIPGSPVRTDLSQARQLYFQVASTFGVAEAQFQLRADDAVGRRRHAQSAAGEEVAEPGPQERPPRRHVGLRQYSLPGRPVGTRPGADDGGARPLQAEGLRLDGIAAGAGLLGRERR